MAPDADLLRRDLERAHLAVAHFADAGRCGDRDLIKTVEAVHHDRVLGAEAEQHAREGVDEVVGIDAEDLPAGKRRIGQRTEEVEDRANAELAPHAGHSAHRRMQLRREEKRNAGAAEHFAHPRRVEINRHAELRQQVGAAA